MILMQILAQETIRGNTLGLEFRRRNYPNTRAPESWELSPWEGHVLRHRLALPVTPCALNYSLSMS